MKLRDRFTLKSSDGHEGAVRILVVDDEASVRDFVDRVLGTAGYVTTVVGDGPEALAAIAERGPFDLLVADVLMPQMTGDELARQVRADTPDMKVLYLTGYSDRLFKEKITLWEDEAFLEKPCSVTGLLEAVSLLLCGHLSAASGFPRSTGRVRVP